MPSLIAVFGAYGATGRIVVSELLARGFAVRAAGRSSAQLETLRASHPDVEVATASADQPGELADLCRGVAAVVNCAGPFVDTSVPVARAAMAAGAPYLDIAAEQPAVAGLFDLHDDAVAAGSVVLPGVGFFGALGDLLATLTLGDWPGADSVQVATALDGWRPTEGTRLTGERLTAPHQWLRDGRLSPADESWEGRHDFPAPFGEQPVTSLCLAETILLARHVDAPSVEGVMNTSPLAELSDPATPVRTRNDDDAGQEFVVEAVVTRGEEVRRAHLRGHDIYAVTAPIVVSALEALLATEARAGVWPVGAVLDPRATLNGAGLPPTTPSTRADGSHGTAPPSG